MPERTGVRICLTYVSCHLNIRKMKSKPNLHDDMLDVWDEAGPDELDTEGDVTLESWTGFSQNPTCLLMVTLLKALQWQTRLRHWRCSSSLTLISGAAMLKKLSQLSILLGSLMWSSTAKTHVFSSYPCELLRRKREVVNKYCFVVWVGGARHNTTVFDNAAGELIERLVELRARIIVYSSEMFQPSKPFCARKSLWEVSTHRWRSRGSCYVLLRGCHQRLQEFNERFMSSMRIHVHFSSVRRVDCASSWQLEGKILTCCACLLDFHISCNGQLVKLVGSRCATEACLHQLCRPCKSMPTLPPCMQDSGFFCCVCSFTFSEYLFSIDLDTKCL